MASNALSEQYAERSGAGLASAMRVPPDRREEPGVCGEWSLKDLLGHLAYWDSVRVGKLEAEAAGGTILTDERDDDTINAEQAGIRADWSWDDVLNEVTSTRERLIALLKQPSKLDNSDVGSHWLGHREQIEAWLARNQPSAREDAG